MLVAPPCAAFLAYCVTRPWSPPLLISVKFQNLGKKIKFPGERCGQGFTESAANDFNLLPGTPVGISLIDAHSGGLGLIGCTSKSIPLSYESRIGK